MTEGESYKRCGRNGTSLKHSTAKIGKGVKIGDFVLISEGCSIEDNTIIGNRVTLHKDTKIGSGIIIQDNCIIGKQPIAGPLSSYKIEEQKGTVIKDKTIIGCGAIIYSGTVIGSEVFIGDEAHIREKCIIGDVSTIGRKATLEFGVLIGSRTRVMNNAQITEGTKIGNNVFIAPDVTTLSDRKMARDKNTFKPPVFQDYSRVGGNAIIMPGVTIGFESAVAAGSVVFQNVKKHTIVLGNPAKFAGIVPKKDRLSERD